MSVIDAPVHAQIEILNSPGSRFEARLRAAQNSAGELRDQELKRVSREFESIFISQLLKVMRETIEESGLTEGGFGKSIYTELFDQEISQTIARRGALGIADLLYKNLAGKETVTPPPDAQPASGATPPAKILSEKTQAEENADISDLQLPVRAPVSSRFGMRRDPFSGRQKFHKGLDLAAPEGTKVVAALPGKVLSAGFLPGYGNTILVQHAEGIQTRYGHLGSIQVKVGDAVDSESVLGTVGQTGRSTGAHLHFEVIRMGEPVDPLQAAGSQTSPREQISIRLDSSG